MNTRDLKNLIAAGEVFHLEFKEGIDKNLLEENSKRSVEFVYDDAFFTVTYRRKNLTSEKVSEKNGGLNGGLNSVLQELLDLIASQPGINAKSLAEKLHRPIDTIDKQIKKLALTRIATIDIPIAPIPEQEAIVSEIETRLSVCDKLEESIIQSLEQSKALRQSILKKAFEGKLVPQDSNDEPASVLLERIRVEREKNKPMKGIRRK